MTSHFQPPCQISNRYLSIWPTNINLFLHYAKWWRHILNPRPAGPSPAPTLCWGGGTVAPPPHPHPHLSRKPTDVAEKFERQWKGLREIFQVKFKNLSSGSPVTSQVRSNTKCLTFSFNAFPPQNAGNKRISESTNKRINESTWFVSVTYLSIVLSPRWPFLRSRSSEVTRSNCRFRSFDVVMHVYGSVFRLEREEWY